MSDYDDLIAELRWTAETAKHLPIAHLLTKAADALEQEQARADGMTAAYEHERRDHVLNTQAEVERSGRREIDAHKERMLAEIRAEKAEAQVQAVRALADMMREQRNLAADNCDEAEAALRDLTTRLDYGDGITEPQADVDTIVRGVTEGRLLAQEDWERAEKAEAQVQAVRALVDDWERCGEGYAAAGVRDAAEGERVRVRAIRDALDGQEK